MLGEALLADTVQVSAAVHAQGWLKALQGDASERFIAVLSEKPAGARGGFADALDALDGVLYARLRPLVETGGDASQLARAHRLGMLAYLLDMAKLEADETMRRRTKSS